MNRVTGTRAEQGLPSSMETDSPTLESVARRVKSLERQNRRMRFGLMALLLLVGYLAVEKLIPESVIIQQTLMESKELKLLDNSGQPRLFLRMFSRVPVLQLLDATGKPRMSLGLRFDDSPFIDLSDKTGRTRATLEMTTEDKPSMQLFDENGDSTFKMQ